MWKRLFSRDTQNQQEPIDQHYKRFSSFDKAETGLEMPVRNKPQPTTPKLEEQKKEIPVLANLLAQLNAKSCLLPAGASTEQEEAVRALIVKAREEGANDEALSKAIGKFNLHLLSPAKPFSP